MALLALSYPGPTARLLGYYQCSLAHFANHDSTGNATLGSDAGVIEIDSSAGGVRSYLFNLSHMLKCIITAVRMCHTFYGGNWVAPGRVFWTSTTLLGRSHIRLKLAAPLPPSLQAVPRSRSPSTESPACVTGCDCPEGPSSPPRPRVTPTPAYLYGCCV